MRRAPSLQRRARLSTAGVFALNAVFGNTVMLGAMSDRLPFPADVLRNAVLELAADQAAGPVVAHDHPPLGIERHQGASRGVQQQAGQERVVGVHVRAIGVGMWRGGIGHTLAPASHKCSLGNVAVRTNPFASPAPDGAEPD